MASVPARRNFTRKNKRPFSYVDEYVAPSHPRAQGDETDYETEAEEIDLDDVDHRKVLLDARSEEENRTIAEKAAKKSLEDEAKQKTVKARALTVARVVANAISPGKKVTIRLKRRGELGGRAKKHTKKQVKSGGKHKQNKHTKRQPKRRN